jgi:hypothetical protein
MDDTPPAPHRSNGDVWQALDQMQETLRSVLREQTATRGEVSEIKQSLASGATVIDQVGGMPVEVATLREQVATLRLLVYGAAAAALLGLFSTSGLALVWVIQHMKGS